jgi:ferricrocin synthase
MIFRSLEIDRPLYFGSFHFELQPSTNIPKLRRAWEAVAARTQILRTRFSSTPDGFAQVVVKEQEIAWDEYCVSSEDERKAITEGLYLAWWRRARDLRNTPFEISIVQSPTKRIMCLRIFHALYDGNSFPILLRRVRSEYFGAIDIDYGPTFHDVLPYGPLCEDEEAKGFWTQRLLGSKPCRMPSLVSEPVQEDSFVTTDLRIPELEATRRSLNTTHQGLIQACWISVLQKYFLDSVTIGVVVSGRSMDLEGIENTIGPLFNTVPFYISFQKPDTWAELVRKCHDFNAAVLPHQHTALRDILKWCRRSPDMPLFDTLFVFQKDDENSMARFQDLWTPLSSSSLIDVSLCTHQAAAGQFH